MHCDVTGFDWAPIWVVVLTTIFAVIAWFYQAALARQERRYQHYASIIDNLQGFTTAGSNAQQRTAAIVATQHLWLVGPSKIVKAAREFLNAAGGSGEITEPILKELIIQMRKDLSIWRIMFPLRRGKVVMEDIQFFAATGQ